MADDLTLGELSRRLNAFERRIEGALKAGDDRHAALASKVVPTDLWKAEHESLQGEVRQLRDDVREAAVRIEKTSLERMGVLTARIDALGRRIDEHEKGHELSGAWSRSKKLAVVGILVGAAATIAAAWLAALLAAKGVH